MKTANEHYKVFRYEPIRFITYNKLDFIVGNIIKYICRYPYKGQAESDLKKIYDYMMMILEFGSDCFIKEDSLQEFFRKNDLTKNQRRMLWHLYRYLHTGRNKYHSEVLKRVKCELERVNEPKKDIIQKVYEAVNTNYGYVAVKEIIEKYEELVDKV